MAENVGSLSRLDTEVKVKKTRASKPKVKTGCQTCKFVFAFTSFLFAVSGGGAASFGKAEVQRFEEYIAKLVQQLEYGASNAMRPSLAVCAA